MEFKLEGEKVLDGSSIQIQVPTPRFCTPKYSPFTQSVMNLTPIHQYMSTPTLYMNPITPEQSFRQFTQISPFEVETPRIARRVIKKIDFSQYFEKFGQMRANTLPVEIKVYQDDAFEHSSLLTSLSKSKPAKRARNQGSVKLGCTCPKSKCLKLYCECFAKQDFCDGCNCNDCHNTAEFEDIRNEAIKATLERNPNAFVPKIAGCQTGPVHRKGCHCSKSGCLLNYCECFQSGAVCSDMCQCSGCRNNEVIKKKKKRSNV